MNDSLQGSLCEAQAIWPSPPNVCRSVVLPSALTSSPGCCGSQVKLDALTLAPTGTAPAPPSLYGWTDTSMQKFDRPWSCLMMLAAVGQLARLSYKATASAPPGPAAA